MIITTLNPKQPTNQPTIWITIGQGPIALAVDAGGGVVWTFLLSSIKGWSGGAMVLGKFPVPGRPTFWI